MAKWRLTRFAFCLPAVLMANFAFAADLHGYLVLTSDYVYRGVTQSDGDAAGQIGLDPGTGKLVEGGIQAQTRQALANLQAILAEAGAGLDDVLKTTVFL